MRLSVVVPVHNGGGDLVLCLLALRAAMPQDCELIVVDDASDDGSAAVAAAHGAMVVQLDRGPFGPAYARNRGVEAASGDLIIFVDADVTVRPDTIALMSDCLLENVSLAAVFGSYDDEPAAPGLVSQYRNLLHHYVHQRGDELAGTFWAGCGAVRKEALDAVGGFDDSYVNPSIEDIELGSRLVEAGYSIRLCKNIQVTHLKRWTLGSMIKSDILQRAVPWTRLILHRRILPAHLNLNWRSRCSSILAWIGLLGLFLGFMWPESLAASAIALILLLVLNGEMYRLFIRQLGISSAGGAAILHLTYLIYSSATFGIVAILWVLRRRPIVLLIAATLVKGFVWSVVVPPWHAPDEMQHTFYAQLIGRSHSLDIEPDNFTTREAHFLYGLAQIRSVRFQPVPLDLSDRAEIDIALGEMNDPSVKWGYVWDDGSNYEITRRFLAMHPPLYYGLVALVQLPLEGYSLLMRLAAGRWLTVCLGAAVVWLAHKVGQCVWPNKPGLALLLASIVSYQPMLTFVTSILGNQALEVALYSALLGLSLLIVVQGMDRWRGIGLGVIVGLGLLTKVSFVASVPLLVFLFGWDCHRRRKRPTRLLDWLWVISVGSVVAGWWYWDSVIDGSGTITGAFGQSGHPRQIPLLRYLLTYGWKTLYLPVLRMYWGNFGWLDTPLPEVLSLLLVLITIISGLGLAVRLLRRPRGNTGRYQVVGGVMIAASVLGHLAFYTLLDYRMAIEHGGSFSLQGRYFLPAIVPHMMCLMVGLLALVPRFLFRLSAWLVGCAMVILNLYAVFAVVAPRYYGVGGLLLLLDRATALQPVSSSLLIGMCLLLAGLSCAHLGSLWKALTEWHSQGDKV